MRNEFRSIRGCRLEGRALTFSDGNRQPVAWLRADPQPHLAFPPYPPREGTLHPDELRYLADLLADFNSTLTVAHRLTECFDLASDPHRHLPVPLPRLLRAEYWTFWGKLAALDNWYGEEKHGVAASELIAHFLEKGTALEVLPIGELHRATHACVLCTPGPEGSWIGDYANPVAYYGPKKREEGGPANG